MGSEMCIRDSLLSPQHHIACANVLVPVADLIDGANIVQERRDQIEYWHLQLESHDLILAENLPCETYLGDGDDLFAPEASGSSPQTPCLPRVTQGPVLQQVRLLLQHEVIEINRPRIKRACATLNRAII